MLSCEENLFERGMPVEALMEKVGLKLKEWFLAKPELLRYGVQGLVGPGHNGGDGLVLARELFLEGISVSIWCPIPIKKELTLKQFSYCRLLGIPEINSSIDPRSKSLWIDALFGVGQSRKLPEKIAKLLKTREEKQPKRLIALDVPSGICSNTGRKISDCAARAAFTLTIGLYKKGLLQDISLPYVGHLRRIDIGIPQNALNQNFKKDCYRLSSDDIASIPWPSCSKNAHKYQRGRTLVLAGSAKYPGAASLSLKGALASGVGAVSAILPKKLADSMWQVLPEVIVQGSIQESINSELHISETLRNLELNKIDSLLIGPGLGLAKENWNNFSEILAKFQGLLILDADALNRLALSQEGSQWISKRQGVTWLTPHLKEFSRLFPELKDLPPIEAAPLAAQNTGACVLLKGAHSIIASPSGFVWQLCTTSHLVARAGFGDLLAGFLAGVGAIGLSSDKNINSELLPISALLHAEAGRICADGTRASSISESLEKLVRTIQSRECVQNDI